MKASDHSTLKYSYLSFSKKIKSHFVNQFQMCKESSKQIHETTSRQPQSIEKQEDFESENECTEELTFES